MLGFVHFIFAEIAKGRKQKDIAAEFGMSEMNVSSIKLKKIWGWLP